MLSKCKATFDRLSRLSLGLKQLSNSQVEVGGHYLQVVMIEIQQLTILHTLVYVVLEEISDAALGLFARFGHLALHKLELRYLAVVEDYAIYLVWVLAALVLVLELGCLDIVLFQHFSHLLLVGYVHYRTLLFLSCLYG